MTGKMLQTTTSKNPKNASNQLPSTIYSDHTNRYIKYNQVDDMESFINLYDDNIHKMVLYQTVKH